MIGPTRRRPRWPLLGALPAASLALLASGCVGPPSLRAGRTAYNEAIQESNSEQLLLNIVRLRYRDAPLFLEVSGVAASLKVQASGGIGATLRRGETTPFGLDARVFASEEPTISYTPLQGEAFVEHLLSPIDASTLLLLVNSGWSIERILRLCAQSMGGLPNAPRASGPTPDDAPHAAEFLEAARLLRELQKIGALELGLVRDELLLRVDPEARGRPGWERLAELLALDPGRDAYRVVLASGRLGEDRIALAPRSVMASMFYVSQGVDVPADDERRGVVTVTLRPTGERYDWSELLGGLLRVHASRERPEGAYVAVRHRDAWFYIDDSDLDSKTTFSMLAQLLALQSGEVRGSPFLLTVPVGG